MNKHHDATPWNSPTYRGSELLSDLLAIAGLIIGFCGMIMLLSALLGG